MRRRRGESEVSRGSLSRSVRVVLSLICAGKGCFFPQGLWSCTRSSRRTILERRVRSRFYETSRCVACTVNPVRATANSALDMACRRQHVVPLIPALTFCEYRALYGIVNACTVVMLVMFAPDLSSTSVPSGEMSVGNHVPLRALWRAQ